MTWFESMMKNIRRRLPAAEDAKLRLALLRENFEFRDFFRQYIEAEKDNDLWPGHDFMKHGLNLFFFAPYPERETILDAVNPFIENPPEIKDEYVSILMGAPAVDIVHTQKNEPPDGLSFRQVKNIPKKPWNRLVTVDLRKSKSQIVTDFKSLLDEIFLAKKEPGREQNPFYDEWEEDGSRRRTEAWTHVAVWQLRKGRKSFSDIARQLGISEGVAKKSFARAFELTQNKKYDPELYRREVWLKHNDIIRTCSDCPNRKTCSELCPEMLAFADQDHTSRKEKLFDDPDYLDSLIFD